MLSHIQQRLSNLLSHNSNNNQQHQNSSSFIKQQLFQFNEYVSQQFLKLSVYYETKLQYQSVQYEEEIIMLKKEIERQYKVIGLMKNQLEDLVVMVNLQRMGNEMEREEHTEWRVKKDEGHKLWQGSKLAKSGNNNNNSNDNNNFSNEQSSQPQNESQSPTTQQPSQHNTIFGLQVIAQQQTQRTLISVCDEQVNGNDEQHIDELDESIQKYESIDEQVKQTSNIDELMRQPGKLSCNVSRRVEQKKFQQSPSTLIIQPTQIKTKDAAVQSQPPQKPKDVQPYQKQEILSQPNDEAQQQINLNSQQQSSPLHYRQSLFEQNEDDQQQFQQKGRNKNIFYTGLQQNHSKNSSIIYSKSQNFVSNPFAKHKSKPSLTNKLIHYQCQDLRSQQKLHQNHSSPKIFLQQFRKSFVQEGNTQSQQGRRQKQQLKRGNQDVMSILEMIAMKGGSSQMNSKRSQRQQNYSNNIKEHHSNIRMHQNSSSSRSKIKPEPNHTSSSKTKTSHKKRISTQQSYRLQYPQQFQYENATKKQESASRYNNKNSRISMNNINNRCDTQGRVSNNNNEESISSQLYQFEQQNDNMSEYYWTSFNNQIQQPKNRSENYLQQDYQQFKSLQTTFGRPVSFECLRQVKEDQENRQQQNFARDDLQKIQRKFSCGGLSGNSKPYKNDQFTKEKCVISNKQNQRQRRMSEKPSSKGTVPIASALLEKKPSAKYIKRPNQNTPANQHSITSMLQSHLEQSNKFLIGSKKQEIKYDGQRMAYGHMTLKHGHGILYYSNGLIYQGEFVENKRQGYGLLKFNHVELYSGEWINDELNGKGKIRNCAIINKKKKQAAQSHSVLTQNKQNNWSSLNSMFMKWISYCGSFKSNRFQGQGTLYLQGGQKFVGWFRNGVADGEGSLFKQLFVIMLEKMVRQNPVDGGIM